VILATTATIGFTVAVLVGIIASCLNFALSYSRVGVVQHDLDGRVIHSTVLRPQQHQDILASDPEGLRVLVLRGVIFFGTASTLLERVRAFLTEPKAGAGAKVLVLDFTHVASTDSSAALTFSKIRHLAEANGVHVLLCGLAPSIAAVLEPGMNVFPSLDHALDAAEEILLAAHGAEPRGTREPLDAWLPQALGGADHWRILEPLLRRREVAAGDVLIQEGDRSDETVYLIEAGRLTITLAGQEQGQRLASLMAGNIVGEMALYASNNRSATVTAESGSIVWALARGDLESLHGTAPDTAMKVHAFIVRTLAGRVQQANATIAALQRGA
jgi:sulfate permease, SulP family